jgi:hypothetical protein
MENGAPEIARTLLLLAIVFGSTFVAGADWSNTELQYQYGRLSAPSFAGGEKAGTNILTFQHASGWKYGDNFFFVDYLDDSNNDGFNDKDFYAELYINASIGKISKWSLHAGPISDVGFIMGLNIGGDPNVLKWLPGIRLAWSLPGFAFLNTDITAYLDESSGLKQGGAPSEDDSFMIDVNWARPFSVKNQSFSVEGHVEIIGSRKNELGENVDTWILAQPQFRYDIGKALFANPNQVFIGIEWQIWINKLGDPDTDENAIQALAVWRF